MGFCTKSTSKLEKVGFNSSQWNGVRAGIAVPLFHMITSPESECGKRFQSSRNRGRGSQFFLPVQNSGKERQNRIFFFGCRGHFLIYLAPKACCFTPCITKILNWKIPPPLPHPWFAREVVSWGRQKTKEQRNDVMISIVFERFEQRNFSVFLELFALCPVYNSLCIFHAF